MAEFFIGDRVTPVYVESCNFGKIGLIIDIKQGYHSSNIYCVQYDSGVFLSCFRYIKKVEDLL